VDTFLRWERKKRKKKNAVAYQNKIKLTGTFRYIFSGRVSSYFHKHKVCEILQLFFYDQKEKRMACKALSMPRATDYKKKHFPHQTP
jgi:hypothetical protein